MAVGAVNIAIGANIGGFTSAMRDATSSVAQFTSAYKEQFGGLKKTADAPRGAFAELNRTLQITKAQIRDIVAVGGKVPAELTAKYALLQRSVAGVNDAFKEAPSRLQQITAAGQGLQSVGSNLTKFVTLPILAVGAAAFRTYAQLDALKLGLANIEGSAAGAEARFVALREVAKLPGLGLEEAVQGDVRLRAVGFSAEESRQALLQFGNALALTGGGKFELNSVLTQLTQMGSKAKVLAEDLKPILTASPAVAKAIKEMFGTVDSEQISAKLQATGRGPREFIDDLVKKLAQLERVAGGPKNALENFGDSLKIAGFEIGRAADRSFGLTAAIDGLGSLIGGAVTKLGEMSPAAQTVTLSVIGLTAAIGPLTLGIGSLIAAGPALTSLLATAKVGFAAITGPIGLAVIGITALGVALYQAQKPLFDTIDKTRLFADVNKRATDSVATEKATIERLLSTARNEQLSKTARIKAVQQLNALSPQYLGFLSLENINSDKAAEAVRKHADAINVRAQARAAEDKLVELYRKRDETAGRDLAEFNRPINGRTQFDPQAGISLTGLTKEQLDAKARKEKADAISAIDKNINDIQSFIRGANRRAARRGVDLGGPQATPFDYSGVGLPGQTDIEKAKDRLKTLAAEIQSLRLKGKAVPAELSKEYRTLAADVKKATDATKLGGDTATKAYKEPITALKFWKDMVARLGAKVTEVQAAGGVIDPQDLKNLATANAQVETLEKGLNDLVDAYNNREIKLNITARYGPNGEFNGFSDLLNQSGSIGKPGASGLKNIFGAGLGNVALPGLDGLRERFAFELPIRQEFERNMAEIPGIFKGLKDKLTAGYGDLRNGNTQEAMTTARMFANTFRMLKVDLAYGIRDTFGSIFESIGAGNTEPLKRALKSILDIISSYAIQIGTSLLFSGSALLAAAPATFGTTAPLGIGQKVAGAGLIAAGGLVKGLSAKAFANGGIVYGPTLGLVGEYSGARSNPEVIAPLNKLKSMIEPAERDPQVFIAQNVVRGDDLVTIYERASKKRKYSGR